MIQGGTLRRLSPDATPASGSLTAVNNFARSVVACLTHALWPLGTLPSSNDARMCSELLAFDCQFCYNDTQATIIHYGPVSDLRTKRSFKRHSILRLIACRALWSLLLVLCAGREPDAVHVRARSLAHVSRSAFDEIQASFVVACLTHALALPRCCAAFPNRVACLTQRIDAGSQLAGPSRSLLEQARFFTSSLGALPSCRFHALPCDGGRANERHRLRSVQLPRDSARLQRLGMLRGQRVP